MKKLSIRTMLLLTLGCGILLSIFTYGSTSANMFHSLLVLAFAIPGASWGYDITRSSRGLVVGCRVSATVGTGLLSAFVLMGGFRQRWHRLPACELRRYNLPQLSDVPIPTSHSDLPLKNEIRHHHSRRLCRRTARIT